MLKIMKTISSGFHTQCDQASTDISIGGDEGQKWKNLKSIRFTLQDSDGKTVPLHENSHLVVKVFNV
tara:strand:- start:241 stop:441 length:201 start_codon:yes stop_codon:yes gene_type:complete